METRSLYSAGGGGGKARKQRFRPSATTPYDRPSSSSRPILPTHSTPREDEELKKGGWLSKLVDPASRVISRTASRLFSSAHSNSNLPPPPPPSAPEKHNELKEEAPGKVSVNQFSGPETKKENPGDDGGISELEQMLMKNKFSRKVFTQISDVTVLQLFTNTRTNYKLTKQRINKLQLMAEFDHLTDLLRSRTLDTSMDDKPKHNEPQTSKQALQYEKQEIVSAFPRQNATEDKFLARISTPGVNLSNNEDEVVSPTELAKAFMSSRPSKPLPYNLNIRSQVLKEAVSLPRTVSFNPVTSNLSAGCIPTFHFSGFQKDGCTTPKSQRISASHRMTKSPYFRIPSAVPRRGDESFGKDAVGPSTSYSTPSSLDGSKGKQQSVLKRRSLDVDSDLELFGPTRRTRQKSDFTSLTRKTPMRFSEKYLCSSVDSHQGFTTADLKTSLLNGANYDSSADKYKKGSEGIISCGNFASVPDQSAKMAQKILKKLDQFTSPPKKKVFELKPVPRNIYPSNSLSGISHGQVVESLENSDLSKAYNKEGSGKLILPDFRSQTNQDATFMHKIIQESGPSEPHALSISKTVSKVGESDMVHSAVDTGCCAEAARPVTVDPMTIPPKSTSFQLQASGASKMRDSNKTDSTSGSIMQIHGNGKVISSLSADKPVLSEISFQTVPFLSSSETNQELSSTFSRETENAITTKPIVLGQEKSFSFPVSFDSAISQPPPTPTMATSFGKQSNQTQEETNAQVGPVKEQDGLPTFTFGLNNVPTLKFASINYPLGDYEDPLFHFQPVSKLLSTSSTDCSQTYFGSSLSAASNSELRSTSIFGQSSSFSDNVITRGSTSCTSFSCSLPSPLSRSTIFSSASGSGACLTTGTSGMSGQVAFATDFLVKDQVNVEECKTDATVQSATSLVPTFGQSFNMPIVSSASPHVGETTVFQFGNQQNHQTLTSQSPVQPAGNLVPQKGSLSLGGGVNMANRRIIKVKRDKLKRK